MFEKNKIYIGDALEVLKDMPDGYIHTCVTSPPYYALRDYGMDGQIGLEETPDDYIARLVDVFREVRRVLRDDGTLWVNIGDSYAGSGKGGASNPESAGSKQSTNKGILGASKTLKPKVQGCKPKDLIGIPWMLAFALRADGWYLRQDIIWHKPNPMPESVKDRCTKSHEYIFLLSKSPRYYFDNEALKEPATSKHGKGITGWGKQAYASASGCGGSPQQDHSGWCGGDGKTKNKRDVWTVTTKPYKGAHFATFPEQLVEPCILAGCPRDGIVLDPFIGSGTTAKVAYMNWRNFVGIEINPQYREMAVARIKEVQAPQSETVGRRRVHHEH